VSGLVLLVGIKLLARFLFCGKYLKYILLLFLLSAMCLSVFQYVTRC